MTAKITGEQQEWKAAQRFHQHTCTAEVSVCGRVRRLPHTTYRTGADARSIDCPHYILKLAEHSDPPNNISGSSGSYTNAKSVSLRNYSVCSSWPPAVHPQTIQLQIDRATGSCHPPSPDTLSVPVAHSYNYFLVSASTCYLFCESIRVRTGCERLRKRWLIPIQ